MDNQQSQQDATFNDEQDQSLQSTYRPLENSSPLSVLDAILKRPTQLIYELHEKADLKIPIYLICISLLCLAAMGLMMGSFSGDSQFWRVPFKVILGTSTSALICLPSLYILLCLSGCNQSFIQVIRLLLLTFSLAGILFIGFMPVVWIFSQATESIAFMGFLYLIVWGIGGYFGIKQLKKTFKLLNNRPVGTLNLWAIIFMMVVLQMSTTLRPIIGEYDPDAPKTKMFFLAHWIDNLDK